MAEKRIQSEGRERTTHGCGRGSLKQGKVRARVLIKQASVTPENGGITGTGMTETTGSRLTGEKSDEQSTALQTTSPCQGAHPLDRVIGAFEGDPLWDETEEIIRQNRQALDAE
jgi:hypothetical protein